MKILLLSVYLFISVALNAQNIQEYDSLWADISGYEKEIFFAINLENSKQISTVSKIISIDRIANGKIYA